MGKILKLAKAGDPILYRKVPVVENPTSQMIDDFAQNMMATLRHYKNLALAANQVYIPWRIVIIDIPLKAPFPRYDFASDPTHQAVPLTIAINPSIKFLSDEMIDGWESCLAFPGLRGKVERYKFIEWTWTDLEGNQHTQEFQGFNARVIQHECDHLDGIVYPSRIKHFSTFGFEEETLNIQRAEEQRGQAS